MELNLSTNAIITLEIIEVFLAYFVAVIVPPAIVFGSKFKEKGFTFPFRLSAYSTFGNTFIIALVLYLNLMHIFHFATMLLFTIAGYVVIGIVLYQIDIVKVFLTIRGRMQSINQGYMGRRTYFHRSLDQARKTIARILAGPFEMIRENPFETLGFIAITALVFYLFGKNEYANMGYTASDLPIHNYLVNGLAVNDPFRDGVYPMGYHAVIVYLYELFRIDIYVLLRHWDILSTVLLELSIITFTAYVCKKHSFLPFLAVFLFVAPACFSIDCYSMFMYGIPQEYGQVFVLPAVMFLFEFMKRRSEEVREFEKDDEKEKEKKLFGLFHKKGKEQPEEAKPADVEEIEEVKEIAEDVKEKKRRSLFDLQDAPEENKKSLKKERIRITMNASTMSLICFAGALSVTVSVHFYATIALILFVAAFAVGYLPRIFKKAYFWSLIKSGILAAAISIPPLMLALAMGIPFSGSMNWALNVMEGSGGADGSDEIIADSTDTYYEDDLAYYNFLDQNDMLDEQGQEEYVEVQKKAGYYIEEGTRKIQYAISAFYNAARNNLFFGRDEYADLAYPMMLMLLFLLGAGAILLFIQPDHGGILITVGVGVFLFWGVLAAAFFGLPEVMDGNRTRTFLITLIGIVVALDIDVVLSIFFHFFKKRWIHTIVSFSVSWLIVLAFVGADLINEPFYSEGYEYNGAMICLERIFKENDDFSFCVVSANDENNMVALRGYHYELLTFLKHLALYRDEGFDADLTISDLSEEEDSDIYIPNKTVYFFIEKVPKDWGTSYERSGQPVSRTGAAMALPFTGTQFGAYQGEARWISMSKMYYWAIVYKTRMADNFTVYYEDSDFICYKATQNTYSLLNFAINYGYNDCGEGEITFND